jgi:hypothetical protein
MLSHLARFRFSLLTLLLAVAWSAVAVRINVTPRVTFEEYSFSYPNASGRIEFGELRYLNWGWPCRYRSRCTDVREIPPPDLDRWALSADAGVGLLLVVVLTWTSDKLLRRVTARLRPRTTKGPKS